MKLGNTSQSIVPVPSFFLTRTLRELDTFNVSNRRRYFREKDLFRMTKDVNFANNLRKHSKKFDEINQEKYIPIHRRVQNTFSSNFSAEKNNSHHFDSERQEVVDDVKQKSVNQFGRFTTYMEKTNVTKITQGDIREGITNNLKSLLEKLNTNFDMEKYNSIDNKANSKKLNSIVYTPITFYNQNNESDSLKFKKTLRDKVNSMTAVNQISKEKALINLNSIKDAEKEKANNKISASNINLPLVSGDVNLRRTMKTATNTYYNSSQRSQIEENTINYNDLLMPSKKNFWKKKQKEMDKKMRDTDEYMSIIKPECYNSLRINTKTMFKDEISTKNKVDNFKSGDKSEISEMIKNRALRKSTYLSPV